jgi:hypothetical protein
MNKSKWVCERCGKKYDLENMEGWIILSEDTDSYWKGKLTPLVPYEKVCYECADELLSLMESCNKECSNCEVSILWGLSIMDCLKLQLKFELLDLPQRKPPHRSSLEEAKEILTVFRRF